MVLRILKRRLVPLAAGLSAAALASVLRRAAERQRTGPLVLQYRRTEIVSVSPELARIVRGLAAGRSTEHLRFDLRRLAIDREQIDAGLVTMPVGADPDAHHLLFDWVGAELESRIGAERYAAFVDEVGRNARGYVRVITAHL